MSNQTDPEPTAERTETQPESDRPDDPPPLDTIQKAGLVVITVALALAISQFLGLGVISDARLRLLIFGGIVCLGGKEAIKLLASSLAP